MKKALALILTAAMLFSCLAVGVSAKRVVTEVSSEVLDHAWFAEGGSFWNATTGAEDLSHFKYTLEINSKDGANYGVQSGGGPYIQFSEGKIGYGDWFNKNEFFTVATDKLVANKWLTIDYVVDGSDVEIFIEGESVGTISDKSFDMKAVVAAVNYGCYVTDLKVTNLDDNSVVYHEDFEGAVDGITPVDTSSDTAYDLGSYYYDAFNSAYYTYIENVAGSSTLSFDFAILHDDGSFYSVYSTAPFINKTTIGFTNASNNIACDLKVDEWYHIEYVCDGSATAVYLNGAYKGTIDVASLNWIGGLENVAIDNIVCDNFTEDFEDQKLNNLNGEAMEAEYTEYEMVLEEKADPFLTLGMDKAAEGGAWLLEDRNDGYGCGYAKDYPSDVVVNGAVAYSFDLALLPNNHRGNPYSAEKDPDGSQTWFEIWRDVATKRFKVGFDTENTQFSGFAGESDSLVGFNWGEMTATNFHNVVIVFANRVGKIYVDGVKLYEGPAGTPGINGTNETLFAIVGGSAIIDNFAIYNVADLDNIYAMSEDVLFSGNIENNGAWEGVKGWTVGADCAENGHVFHNIDTTTTETCYSLGYDTVYCAVCGEGYETHERAMLDHNYTKYDINRTADGLIYAYCQADGCVDKKYVTPTEEAYTGTMNVYLDMSDDMAAAIYSDSTEPNIFDNFKFENGVATTCAETYLQNYSRFSLEQFSDTKPSSADWSVTFDLTFNGTWDTDDNINSGYEHFSLFMLGGNNSAFVTFNFDKDFVEISPNTWSGASVTPMKEAYDFVEGETYNVQFSFKQYEVVIDEWYEGDELIQWKEPAVDFYVTINGVDVICYDYETLESGTLGISYDNPGASLPGFYNQNFGVNYSFDNFVVGSSDFDWSERTYVGDVNGDNYLDAADALAMRKLLAKVIDDSALATSRMDANGDGAINAKDQLTIRKALAA